MYLFNYSSSWQEEEDQAAPAPPRHRQAQDHRSHSPVPRNHCFCRRQGRTPRQDRPSGRRYHCPEEAFGKQAP